MSHPLPPEKAFFFLGITLKEIDLWEEIKKEILKTAFDKEILSFSWFEFSRFTSYYEKEMGTPLFKNFVFFTPLKTPDFLIKFKHLCYEIEKKHSVQGKRKANLDPGYMELSKIVLATFKNFSHRIYLGEGVYAEVTLIFKKGSFEALPWSYPDYVYHIPFFNKVRNLLKELRIKENAC